MFKRCMGVTAAYGADNRIYGELSERSKVQHSKFYGDLVVSSAGNP